MYSNEGNPWYLFQLWCCCLLKKLHSCICLTKIAICRLQVFEHDVWACVSHLPAVMMVINFGQLKSKVVLFYGIRFAAWLLFSSWLAKVLNLQMLVPKTLVYSHMKYLFSTLLVLSAIRMYNRSSLLNCEDWMHFYVMFAMFASQSQLYSERIRD